MKKFDLKKFRRQYNLTQKQTASLLDLPQSAISFMEKGYKHIREEYISKLQENFEFNPEDYFYEVYSDLTDSELRENRIIVGNSLVKFEKKLEETLDLITQRIGQIETTLNDFMQDYKNLSEVHIQSLEQIIGMQQKQIQSYLDMIIEKHKGERKE